MDYLSFFPEGPIKPLLELFKGFIRFLLKMDSEQGEKNKDQKHQKTFQKDRFSCFHSPFHCP